MTKQANSVAERWLTAKLGDGPGIELDAVLAHARRDGHSEQSLRVAHRALGFIEFAHPDTGVPVWSSFSYCVARPDGSIAFATPPRQQAALTTPPVGIVAQRLATAPGPVTTSAPARVAPPTVAHSNAVLRQRINGVLGNSVVDGRERLAMHLIAKTDHEPKTVLAALSAAGTEFNAETRELNDRIGRVLSSSESHGREAAALEMLMVRPAMDGGDIFRKLGAMGRTPSSSEKIDRSAIDKARMDTSADVYSRMNQQRETLIKSDGPTTAAEIYAARAAASRSANGDSSADDVYSRMRTQREAMIRGN